ncbi:MAG: PaREP1 family protein [Vulcanisaeta sp.]|nr:PaREP1 family protein [Vulcanisaeta sp.]MCG2892594.1 PaREP1 family protein [Vulcanisaeta sp.]
MEGRIPTIERHRDAYIKIMIIESLQELQLAVRLLKEGFSRNAASNVFMAWKAMISALVVANLEKMPRDDKEREWYIKTGFLAPTTGLKGISQRLEELGYKVLDLTSTVLALHRYSYNGLYRGASDYATREEAIRDIQHVAKELLRLIREYLSKYWDDEIEENYRAAEKLLNELKL